VAIITHGGIFARILSAILEVQAPRYWFLMNNCGISRIDFDDDGRINLLYLNKVDFLPDHMVT
jgi:broad specificity phosphatase PhoE